MNRSGTKRQFTEEFTTACLMVTDSRDALQSAERCLQSDRCPRRGALATRRGVSPNTALAAYDELVSVALIRGRRGAGMFVAAAVPTIDGGTIMCDAQFPSCAMGIRDPDGNRLPVTW